MFLEVLKSYEGKTNLTIEVNERGLHVECYSFPVESFSRQTTPPASFQVFPVTDLYVLGKPKTP